MEEEIYNLFLSAKNGESRAFDKIYKKYFTPIYRYLFFRLRDKDLADDLTQEVFIRAFNNIGQIDPTVRNPLAYFYTIARNLLIDNYRRAKHPIVSDSEAEKYLIEADNPESIYEENEATKQLMTTLEKISEMEAEAIILKYLRGLSNSEIAQVMNKSNQTIRKLQSRGLKSLKQFYGNI